MQTILRLSETRLLSLRRNNFPEDIGIRIRSYGSVVLRVDNLALVTRL